MADIEDPTPEERERFIRDFFANFDEKLARVREEEARFEAWAALAVRLIGLPPEEKLATLHAEGLTSEEWARRDEDYRAVLTIDMRVGLDERPAKYAALYKAEMARRRAATEGPSR